MIINWVGNILSNITFNEWITAALVLVGFIQSLILWRQAKLMGRQSKIIEESLSVAKESANAARIQAETMRQELILTQRPKLRVRNIVMPELRDSHPQEVRPSGEFYIVNIGGAPATITAVGCWVEYLPTGLPMERPYDYESPNCLDPVSRKIQAGQSLLVKFADGRPRWKNSWSIFSPIQNRPLYVLGYVEYVDDIGTPRRTSFCREYHAQGDCHTASQEKKFFPVQDIDYEYEE